jgi:four helix bundle protein
MSKDFKNLIVWVKAHQLTLEIYRETMRFPQDELYGLRSQIRRASSSIAANIAEGCGRGGEGELARSLQIAMGSASELEYHLLLARDLQLVEKDIHKRLNSDVIDVKRMLSALIKKIRTKP